MIDYKITDIQLSSQGIAAKITVYAGDITTENEMVLGETQSVTRYRRTSKLVDRTITLDAAQVTDLVVKYLNKRLAQEAQQRGQTVISEQSSTTV